MKDPLGVDAAQHSVAAGLVDEMTVSTCLTAAHWPHEILRVRSGRPRVRAKG